MTVTNKVYHVAYNCVGMITFICEYNIVKDKIVIVNHFKSSEYKKKEDVDYNNNQEVLDKVYKEVKQNNIFNLY